MNPLLIAVDRVLTALLAYYDGRSPQTFTEVLAAADELKAVRQQMASDSAEAD